MEAFFQMAFIDVCKLPGVRDVTPVQAKAKFAKALMAESKGEHQEAESLLEQACAA